MTINLSDNSPRISYSVAESTTQTSFAVPFEFFDDDDLNVYVDGTLKTLTTDYTTTGGDGSTGSITMSVTGASGGSTVVITRDIDIERTTDFPTSGPFQIAALNTELDRITAIAADLDDRAARALQLTDYDAAANLTLPDLDTRKGKTLAFNLTTGAVEAGPSTADVQSVSDTAADIALLADIQDGTIATNAITNVSSVSTDVTTLSPISTDITTVSGISANVTTVAGVSADVTTVAGVSSAVSNLSSISSDVTTASGISSDITTVAGDSADIQSLAAVSSNIGLLGTADAISDMNALATSPIITDMDALANLTAEIDALGDITTAITTVSGISSDVTTVSGISANVTSVAGISSNVTTVASYTDEINTISDDLTSGNFVAGSQYDFGNITDAATGTSGSPDGFIVTVYNNLTDITSVAGVSSGVSSLAPQASNISTLAGISADITTAATNVSDITNFADVYIGGASSNPTTRTDGSSLQTGDLFFNSTSSELRVYNGSAWQGGVTASAGLLTASNNLSDVSSAATSRTNLGLGSAATSDTSDFAAAAHTHTLSDITDSGTMASQNANNVNITGGIIDGGSIV